MRLFSPRRSRALVIWVLVSHLGSFVPLVHAGPEGGTVAAGSATIGAAGGVTTITQSTDKAIVNWQSFSTAAHEGVRFAQPNAGAVTLNRVTGDSASRLDGSMNANGRVFLLNPNGVVFGATSSVNTAGLVVSTLNMKDADFMAGRYKLEQAPGKPLGAVINKGHIRTSAGGSVALVAPVVSNEGTIEAPGGRVALAAGQKALVNLDGAGLVNLEVEPGAAGDVQAPSDAAGVISTVVNNRNLVDAGSVHEENGVVTLGGAEGIAHNSGRISVDGGAGATAGRVEVRASQLALNAAAGEITARGTGANQKGGTISFIGGRTGVIQTAKLDASGRKGGGTVHLGGEKRGGGSDQRSKATLVGDGAVVRADALEDGDGGTVIGWGDELFRTGGVLSVRGAGAHGAGGFVETSAGHLEVFTAPDIGADHGNAGTWLIDPFNVNINGGGGLSGISQVGDTFTPTGTGSSLGVDAIIAALGGNNATVIVETALGAGEDGDINLNVPLNVSGTGTDTLIFRAHDDIRLQGGGIVAGAGSVLNVELRADMDASGAGDVFVQNSVDTNGGTMSMSGLGYQQTVGTDVRTNGGAVAMTFQSGIDFTDSLITTRTAANGGGNVTMNAGGNITLGAIDAGDASSALTIVGITTTGSVTNGLMSGTNVEGTALIINAGTGVSSLATQIRDLSVRSTTGDIEIDNVGNLTVLRATTGMAATSSDGDIALAATGNMNLDGTSFQVRAESDMVTLTVGGAIVDPDGAATNIVAGLLIATVGAGVTGLLDLQVDDIDLTNTTSGDVSLNFQQPLLGANIQNAAPGGNVTLSADPGLNIFLGNPDGGSVSADTVTINAPGAAIFEASNVDSVQGRIVDISALQVGVFGTPLDVNASEELRLNLGIIGFVNSNGTPNLLKVTSNGDFQISLMSGFVDASAGTLTGTIAGGPDLDLSRPTGDWTIDSLDVGGSDVAIAATTGRINDDSDAGANDITANLLTLRASTGIGNLQDLEVTTGVLDAMSGTGNILIAELNGVTLRRIETGAAGVVGDGDITFSAGGNILLGDTGTVGVVAERDTATISTTSGSINDGNGNALKNVVAGAATLSATGGIGGSGELEISVTDTFTASTVNGTIDLENDIASGTPAVALSVSGTGNILFGQIGGQSYTTGSVVASGGAVTLGNTGGDITIGSSLSASGNVSLYTVTGGDIVLNAIVNGGAAVDLDSAGAIRGASRVTGSTIDIYAVTGIGVGTPLEIASDTIAIDNSGTGDVMVTNIFSGDVTVTSVTAAGTGDLLFANLFTGALTVNTASTANGDLTVRNSGGGLTVAGSVTAAGAGKTATVRTSVSDDVTLTGTVTGPSVTIQAANKINGNGALTGDSILLVAPNGIGDVAQVRTNTVVLNASANVGGDVNVRNTTTAASNVAVSAAGTGNVAFEQLGGGAVDVLLASANNGSVQVTNTGADLRVAGAVSANGTNDITLQTLTSGNILLNGTTTGADVVVIDSVGSITNGGLVSAGSAQLTAATGIGDVAQVTLNADAISLMATTGGIDARNTHSSAVSLDAVAQGTGNLQFEQFGGGALTLGTVSTTSGNIRVASTGGNITVTTPISAGGSNLTVQTITSGDIGLDADLTGANVTVSAAGDMDGAGLVTATTAASFAAGGDIGVTTPVQASAPSLSATAGGGIDLTNALATGTASVTNLAAGGDVLFGQTGGANLNLGTVSGTGTLSLQNTGGDLVVATSVIASGASTISLATVGSGDIQLDGTTSNPGFNISIDSAGKIDGGGLVNAGSVDLDAVSGVGAITPLSLMASTVAIDVSGTGGIRATNSVSGGITVNSLTTAAAGSISYGATNGSTSFGTITATNGDISLTGDNTITLSGPITGAAVGSDLTVITSGAGQINTIGTISVTASATLDSAAAIDGSGLITAGSVALTAGSGLGATSQLELATATLSAISTGGSSATRIHNTSAAAVTVTDFTTGGSGAATYNQTGGGAVLFSLVNANGGGSVTLTNTGGNVTLDTVNGGTGTTAVSTLTSGDILVDGSTAAGVVQLNSAGAIDGGGGVTATTVDMVAQGDIGVGGALTVVASTLDAASTVGGSISLKSTNAGGTTATLSTAGAGSIAFDQLSGILIVNGAVTANGGITLDATAGGITVNGPLTAAGAGSDVLLSTTAGGNIVLTGATTAADQAILNVAGSINGGGLVSALDVSLTAGSGIGNATQVQLSTPSVSIASTTGNVNVMDTIAGFANLQSLSANGASVQFTKAGSGALQVSSLVNAGAVTRVTNSAGDVNLTGLAAFGAGQSFFVTATGGKIDTSGLPVGGAGSAITFNASGDISGDAGVVGDSVSFVAGGIVTASGGYSIDANFLSLTASGTGDVDVDTTSSGRLTVSQLRHFGAGGIIWDDSSSNGMRLSGVSTLNGAIALNSSTSGDLEVATVVNSGSSSLDISTAGNILVVNGTVGTLGTVTLNSGGAIVGGGSGGVVGFAGVNLTASNGIGDGGSLLVNAPVVNASVTGAGAIQLSSNNTSGVSANLLNFGSGDVTFDQLGGSLSIGSLAGNGNVSLTNAGGDIVLSNDFTSSAAAAFVVQTMGSGNITLPSISLENGTVSVNVAGALTSQGLLTADTLVVSGGTAGIGANGPLLTAAQNLSVTAAGNVNVQEMDGVTLLLLQSTAGRATLESLQGDILLARLAAGAGAKLDAKGGRIEAGTGRTPNVEVNGDVSLFASGVIGTVDDPLRIVTTNGRFAVRALDAVDGVSAAFTGTVGPNGTPTAIGTLPGTVVFNSTASTRRLTSILTVARFDPALAIELFGSDGALAVQAIQTQDKALARSLLRSPAASNLFGSSTGPLSAQEIADLNSIFGTPAPTPAPVAPVVPAAPVVTTPAPAPAAVVVQTPTPTPVVGTVGTPMVGGVRNFGGGNLLTNFNLQGGGTGAALGGTAPVSTGYTSTPAYGGTASYGGTGSFVGTSAFGGTGAFGGGGFLGGTGTFGGTGMFGGFGSFGGFGGFGGLGGFSGLGGTGSFGGTGLSGLGGTGSFGGTGSTSLGGTSSFGGTGSSGLAGVFYGGTAATLNLGGTPAVGGGTGSFPVLGSRR